LKKTLFAAGLLTMAGAVRLDAAESLPPVVSEIVIAAPAAVIWNAYTQREQIEAWMVATSSGPDLRIGGQWLSSYDPNSKLDDDTVIRNEILAFDPGRMLAVRTLQPPADFPFPNAILDTWSVLYLEPIDAARTKVIVRMFGFSDEQESREMRAFFERGNAYELRMLAAHVEQDAAPAAAGAPVAAGASAAGAR
jgi:uncharacterized protein YndB with AHSA1/START domain